MSTTLPEAFIMMDSTKHIPRKIQSKFKDFPKPKEWLPNAIRYYKAKIFGTGGGGVAYRLRENQRKKQRLAKEITNY